MENYNYKLIKIDQFKDHVLQLIKERQEYVQQAKLVTNEYLINDLTNMIINYV